jgi:hypothetical protein
MVTRDQVNMEFKHVAALDDLDIVFVIFKLVSPAEVGIAVVVLVSRLHGVLYRARDIWGCCQR